MEKSIYKSLVLFVFAFLVFLNSCSKDQGENIPAEPVIIDISEDQISLINAGNLFAFDLFKKVVDNSEDSENIIISPLSISSALSMTLNGANGETRNAIIEALRVNGLTPGLINAAYKNLTEALLKVDKLVTITVANSVWTENNFVAKTPFKEILTNYYSAEARQFDITNPQAPVMINTWIENKTNGLIKNMIDKLNENTVMLLINAIYFKGKWNAQFDIRNTLQKPFYKPGGNISEVPMMKQKADFKIYPGTGFVLAEFLYGQGNFVMDIILPDDPSSLTDIIQSLSDINYESWLVQMRMQETELSFPRFKYGYKKQLKDILTDLGMGIAFTDNADFSNISDLNLLINEVTHQAFIETNEEGTEAAAATIVDIGVTSMPPPPFNLNVDHPFIFIIRETTTNTILFMGRVADPLAN